MASSILYQNPESTVILIDIPRSIELAQGIPESTRKLLSAEPLAHQFPSLEPKSAKAKAKIGAPSLKELLFRKHLEFALDEIRDGYDGEWCLARVTERPSLDDEPPRKKLKREVLPADQSPVHDSKESVGSCPHSLDESGFCFTNQRSTALKSQLKGSDSPVTIPPHSTFVNGDIAHTLDTFETSAPQFNLTVLDPPWPNRSARRKQAYHTSYGTSDIRSLLSSIPISSHLIDNGIVAIWITNKQAFREMVIGLGGLFEEWGLTLIEEWIWVKTTVSGDPICGLDSSWRKPWEVLLVGRRGVVIEQREVKRRVLAGVPDLHSRKPNLKGLFEQMMERVWKVTGDEREERKEEYEALEVFARNLTAGWWSWGNEALKFQRDECWVEEAKQ